MAPWNPVKKQNHKLRIKSLAIASIKRSVFFLQVGFGCLISLQLSLSGFPLAHTFRQLIKQILFIFLLHIHITTTCTSIMTEILDTVCHLRVKKIQHFGSCTFLHVESEQGQRGFYSGGASLNPWISFPPST